MQEMKLRCGALLDSPCWSIFKRYGIMAPNKRLLSNLFKKFTVLIRILGWIWNIIMLGWTMRSIHTTSRSTDPDRLELSKIPSLLVFVGHTGTMGN